MRLCGAWLLAASLAAWPGPAAADDDDPLTDDALVVKTESSHRLLLPKDWPIRQEDGLIKPVPVEEYLSLKFGQVRTKFERLDDRISRLERQVAELAAYQQELLRGLKRLEPRAEPAP